MCRSWEPWVAYHSITTVRTWTVASGIRDNCEGMKFWELRRCVICACPETATASRLFHAPIWRNCVESHSCIECSVFALSISLSLSVSLTLSVSLCLSVSLTLAVSICLSISLSLSLCAFLSLWHLLPPCVFLSLCHFLSACLCDFLSLCHFLSLCPLLSLISIHYPTAIPAIPPQTLPIPLLYHYFPTNYPVNWCICLSLARV